MISQNVIKTYSLMTYFNAAYMAGALGMSLCHYVFAMSPYLWGISVITPLPLGEGRGGGASWWVRLCCSFFLFYIVCLQLFYEYSFFSRFFYLILYP